MPLNLERLLFDPADPDNSPNVGSYVRAGTDGDLISSTLVGGKEGLDVNLVNASVIVSATDLDIRDLSHTQDSIKIGDGTDFMLVNADGSINVNLVADADDGIFAEDTAAANADKGQSVFAVRSDAQGTLVSASGDYAWFQQDGQGRLKVNEAPNGAISQAVVAVGTSEVSIGSALTGRNTLVIQNHGNKSIFVGPTGVLTTTGIEVTKGGTLELKSGQAHLWFAISSAAAQDIVVTQLS